MRPVLWLMPLLSFPLLAAGPVLAQPVGVRVGTHGGFGRVVFDFPQPQSFTSERAGNALVLHFPGGGDVPDSPAAARNVVAVTGGGAMATVTIAPGSRLRIIRMDNRVVVDVLDPAQAKPRAAASPAVSARAVAPVSSAPSAPAVSPVMSSVPPQPETTLASSPLADPPPSPVPTQAAAPPSPSPAGAPADGTLALAATRVIPPAGGSAAMLPFGPAVGAASFRHGDAAWIVFDDRRPLDLANLADDPTFAGATVELLPSATLLRLQLPASRVVMLNREADGWSVLTREGPVTLPVTMPAARPERLLFSVPSSGQVVAVPDADTGSNLLVGTLKSAGPGVPVTFHAPEFTIDPSWQGIVVEPVSGQDRPAHRAGGVRAGDGEHLVPVVGRRCGPGQCRGPDPAVRLPRRTGHDVAASPAGPGRGGGAGSSTSPPRRPQGLGANDAGARAGAGSAVVASEWR